MENQQPVSGQKRAPRGSSSAKVDDKGRLKLTSEVLKFLDGKKHFFLTTMDGKSARLYPIEMWDVNEALLQAKAKAGDWKAEAILNRAIFYGKDEELDDSGRIHLKIEMRKDFGFEGQDLVLLCKPGGRIDIMSERTLREENARLLELAKHELGAVMTDLL